MDELNQNRCRQLLLSLKPFHGCCELSEFDVLPFLLEAEADICIHLRKKKPLPEILEPKVLEVARLRILKAKAQSKELKSVSYSEGELSKSETYLTPEDFEKAESKVFDSLSCLRGCRIVEL